MAVDVGSTIDGILACLLNALDGAGRTVCRDGITVGPPVLGPSACCKCTSDHDGGPGGQLSGTLQRLYPVDPTSFGQVAQPANCRPGAVAADLAFTLARCHPTIDNQGNPPTLDDVAPFADGVNDDAQTLWNAIVCCTGYRMIIRDVGVDSDPLGGCSAVGLRVTVLVSPLTPVVGS